MSGVDGPSVVLHIGYHKTATSWLQSSVFPAVPGVFQHDQTSVVLEELVSGNPFEYEPDRIRARLLADAPSDQVTVISNERLSGHPDSAGYDARVLADRLYELFPDAKVVVTVRRQPEMVLACYTQYVRAGGAESLRRFLRPPRGTHRRLPHFDLRFLEYHHLLGYYQALFGPDRVLVLAYEQLLESHGAFVDRIVEFMGLEPPRELDVATVNRSLSPLTLGLKRHTNVLVSRDSSNPNALVDHSGLANFVARRYNRADRRLPDTVRSLGAAKMARLAEDTCRGRFAESNARTSEITGLPLEGLGYEVTSATREDRDPTVR